MLDEIGLFDESFFLYCEDTDLGLRARWAGWDCRYVPGAVVEHRYSESAGRASPLKAYYVERNRLYTIVKNFPAGMLWAAPFASVARYFWHMAAIVAGRGKAAEYRQAGHSGGAAALAGDPGAHRRIISFAGSARGTATGAVRAANHSNRVPGSAPAALDHRPAGGRAVTPAVNQAVDQSAKRLLILIPAFNEEGAVGGVVKEVRSAVPGTTVLVVDDCSVDRRAAKRTAPARKCWLCRIILAWAAAYKRGIAWRIRLGYDYVIRVDGDGQHDPRDIPVILKALEQGDCEMVIGSRFVEDNGTHTSLLRAAGIVFFRAMLRPILGRPVRDPTSGFVGVNRTALELFAATFPLEYPEIEALVVLQRKRFRFVEVPCRFRPRRTGRSTITTVKSLYYIIHVLLGVFVNVLKFEGRRK